MLYNDEAPGGVAAAEAPLLDVQNENRRSAGAWLKGQRERKWLTQREIAEACGLRYVSFISQIELGKVRVPPGRWADYAQALKMDPHVFARELFRRYEPEVYNLLFPPA